MILPDINLLVHAHNLDSKVHDRAIEWWDQCLSGRRGVGLAWAVILGFIRITTNHRILVNPWPVEAVLGRLESWLSLPHFHICQPSDRHFEILNDLLRDLGTAANLTTDAHLAALAIEKGYELNSTDYDFARFRGLKWRNPLMK